MLVLTIVNVFAWAVWNSQFAAPWGVLLKCTCALPVVGIGLTSAFSSLDSGRCLPSSRHLSIGTSRRGSVISSNETRISPTVPKFETIQTIHLRVVDETSGKAEGLCVCSLSRGDLIDTSTPTGLQQLQLKRKPAELGADGQLLNKNKS